MGRPATLVLAAAACVLGFGCTYDPHFQSGVTRCAPATVAKRCPDGYACNTDGLCIIGAVSGEGGASDTGIGGAGGLATGAGGQTTGTGGTAAGGHAGAGSGGMPAGSTGGAGAGGVAGTGGIAGTGGTAGNGAGGTAAGLGGMTGTGGVAAGGAGGSVTGTIVTYKIPTAGSHPSQITVGPDNNLWFVEAAASKIGRCTTGGVITDFPTTTDSAGPLDIVSLGGFLWFIESNVNKIGKADTSGNMLGEFPIMLGTDSTVTFLAAGPDGNIWYTDSSNNNIGRMTPAGISALFPATAGSDPLRISAGPDGNMWFTEFIGNRISKITTTGTIAITRYTISSTFPVAIASDKSTGLVFLASGRVGRITTAGQVTGEYPLPTGVSLNQQGGNVVLGPDGNFWFSNGKESILRMTPTGTMTHYTVPGTNQNAHGMAVGPDGNLWFTDNMQNFVGRISP